MRVTLDKLEKLSNIKREFKVFLNFPAILRDLSVVVEKDVKQGDIETIIRSSVPDSILGDLRLYDVYKFDNEMSGNVSYTYTLKFQSDEKTLTNEEVNALQEKIIKNLTKKLNAQIRK
jgi:phenylalanyl-tRNA synthetase beta chain